MRRGRGGMETLSRERADGSAAWGRRPAADDDGEGRGPAADAGQGDGGGDRGPADGEGTGTEAAGAARGRSQGEARGRHTNGGSDWPGVNKTTEERTDRGRRIKIFVPQVQGPRRHQQEQVNNESQSIE